MTSTWLHGHDFQSRELSRGSIFISPSPGTGIIRARLPHQASRTPYFQLESTYQNHRVHSYSMHKLKALAAICNNCDLKWFQKGGAILICIV
jgi:hypothetical protein